MSRSGYEEDWDGHWALIRYRGAVKSAMRGKRGQQFLRDLVSALDALPEKRLVADVLRTPDGEFCALGAVAAARGTPLDDLDPDNIEAVAPAFGIAEALAREVVWENDEAAWGPEAPEARFLRMRAWAAGNIV